VLNKLNSKKFRRKHLFQEIKLDPTMGSPETPNTDKISSNGKLQSD
jgi:hypothetical protein